jgi:type I restriction enzyme S subunit
MTNSENSLVPALRFNEFEGGWHKKSVNQLVENKILDKPLDGNHGNIHPVASDFVKTGIPFVMANSFKDGKILLDKAVCIKKEQADKLQKGFSKTGDVLLTHKGSVGLTAIVPEIETDYIMLTPQVTYYRVLDNSELSNTFLKTTFETYRFQKRLKILADGGTRPYIGITLQRTLEIPLPSLPEQQKIASFLSAVDDKVQQLTKKAALLEDYKKGVMQQLFTGQLRFKAEDGKDYPDWEERYFKDIVIEYRLGGNYTNTEEVTIYPLIKMGNLGRGKIKLKKLEYIPVDEEIDSKDKIEYGDLFFNTRNTLDLVGKVSIWRNELPEAYYNSNLMYLKFENNLFMNYRLNSYEGVKGLKRFATGTTSVAAIYTKDLLKLPLNMPCLEEQQKIATYLSSIDTKIESVNTQITQTRLFKKGLLQKMFI